MKIQCYLLVGGRRAEFIQHPQELEGSLVPGMAPQPWDHGVSTGLPFLTLGHTNPALSIGHLHSLIHFSEHVLPDTHLFLYFSHQAGAGNGFFQGGDVGLPCSGSQGLALLPHTQHHFYFSPFIFFPSHIWLETEVNVRLLEFI